MSWFYQSVSLPLTYSAQVTSEEYLCAEYPPAFRLVSEQNYDGSIVVFVDHYIDGFGVAMMEWYDTIYMAEDCYYPVSEEQVSWEGLKANYR